MGAPYGPDSNITLPPRSLLWAKPVMTDDGPAIEIGCDCATVTQHVIPGWDHLEHLEELALTCGGCQSVTWVTVGPVDQLTGTDEEGDGDDERICYG